LAYPAGWNPDSGKQKGIDEVIRRHLGADLACTFGPHAATWRHPPAPPPVAPFEGFDQPAHRVHLATLPGGRKWVADLQHEEPHLLIAAGTGGGKTATAGLVAAHARAHGWLVDIIDPKRRSYIDRKTGADVLTNVPGIRIHTSIDAMLWALEEFYLSMLGINIAVGDRTAWPAAFPSGCWSSMSSAPSPGWPPATTAATGTPARRPRWTSGGNSNGKDGRPGTGCWSPCTSRTCGCSRIPTAAPSTGTGSSPAPTARPCGG
jgi:hypothetical protein